MVFIRKITSAVRAIRSNGALNFFALVRKNLRQWRIKRAQGEPFTYQVGFGQPFVCIPLSSTSIQLFISGGEYERSEIDICRAWVRPGDICIDGGANVGLFSVALSDRVGSSGKVIAIEPVDETRKFLEIAVSVLGLAQIHVESTCLSNADGVVDFQVAMEGCSDVSASMKPHALLQHSRIVQVRSSSLDNIVAKHTAADRLALVKLDIEGAEPLALAGARSLFQTDATPMFLVEVHRATLASFSFGWSDILRHFPLDRFELFHVQRSTCDTKPNIKYGVLYPLNEPDNHEWPWYSNVLAIPRFGKFAERRLQIANLLPSS